MVVCRKARNESEEQKEKKAFSFLKYPCFFSFSLQKKAQWTEEEEEKSRREGKKVPTLEETQTTSV